MGDKMEFIKYGSLAVVGLTVFIILIFAIIGTKPLKTLLINACLGLAALALVDLISKFTGVYIHLNEWSIGASSVFGIPAVCGLVLLQMII